MRILICAFAALCLSFAGCDKKGSDTPTPPEGKSVEDKAKDAAADAATKVEEKTEETTEKTE